MCICAQHAPYSAPQGVAPPFDDPRPAWARAGPGCRCRNHVGSTLGRLLVELGVDVGSSWGRSGVDLRPIWGECQVDLGCRCVVLRSRSATIYIYILHGLLLGDPPSLLPEFRPLPATPPPPDRSQKGAEKSRPQHRSQLRPRHWTSPPPPLRDLCPAGDGPALRGRSCGTDGLAVSAARRLPAGASKPPQRAVCRGLIALAPSAGAPMIEVLSSVARGASRGEVARGGLRATPGR